MIFPNLCVFQDPSNKLEKCLWALAMTWLLMMGLGHLQQSTSTYNLHYCRSFHSTSESIISCRYLSYRCLDFRYLLGF